jgi:gamma-glutamylcyclotransferase (GGCT)/AIG2-like uncharacterized protein YtfP
MNNLFVYGTLKSNVVLSAVLGRSSNLPKPVPATLHNFMKYSLNIYPYNNHQVDGYLLNIENEADWTSLDKYENIEGGLYHKINVEVELNNGDKVEAIAYQLVGTE